MPLDRIEYKFLQVPCLKTQLPETQMVRTRRRKVADLREKSGSKSLWQLSQVRATPPQTLRRRSKGAVNAIEMKHPTAKRQAIAGRAAFDLGAGISQSAPASARNIERGSRHPRRGVRSL